MSTVGIVLLVLLVLFLVGGFAIHGAFWLFLLALAVFVVFCGGGFHTRR
jgi:hypothetical protein